MRVPVLRPLSVPVAILCAAPAAAQFAESSAVVHLERSVGVARNLFGYSVVPLGDVDGDTVLDMAVGAPFSAGGSASSAGRVYALSGATGAILWERFETRQSAILGYSLEALDWNGDGELDVVSGAPFSQGGRTWVFSGVDGATLATLSIPTASGFGAALEVGGDLDGDGTEDLVVGAPFTDSAGGTSAGRVYVYSRGATQPYVGFDGPATGAEFGIGLAWVGDVDGDGRHELAVGRRDPNDFFAGFATAYTWNGAFVDELFTVSGVGMGFNLLGDRMDGGKDVSGDGVPDFLVGDMNASLVKVFSGVDGALLATLDDLAEGAGFGTARMVSDMDGDGVADVVSGSWKSSARVAKGGRVLAYSVVTGDLLKAATCTVLEQNAGIDVREMGDFDGDGTSDLLVGAYGDGFSGPVPGAVMVLSGELPRRRNRLRPAELASDPRLIDVGGDPASGPIVASTTEVFDLSLDCSGAAQPGYFAIQVRLSTFVHPTVTPYGHLWIGGNLLYRRAGLHARDVVFAAPGGLVLPNDPTLVGRVYGAQGLCGLRFSNAIRQRIGG